MTRQTLRLSILSLLFSLIAVTPAPADSFQPLPGLTGKSKTSNLRVQVVRYDGGTNGAMVIDVKNNGNKAQTFSADGLFFVPEGDPEKAPQRLGAAGPFVELASKGSRKGKQSKHRDKLVIGPGQTRRLALAVFCIDSHRSSPNNNTRFTLAKQRLPNKLRQQLSFGNQRILRDNKGDVARSKSAIQSHMWKTRDAEWIELEGERVQEKSAPNLNIAPQEMRNRIEPIQQRVITEDELDE